jgi:hypothetical protein
VKLLEDMLFVELTEGILFEKLVKITGDWLWRNGRIGSMPEVGFGCSGKVAVEEEKDMMKNIAGGGGPLHGVIHFSGCRLLRRLCGILLHFSFRLKKNGAIFGAMIDFTVMVHTIRRFKCVWASAVTLTPIWRAASLESSESMLCTGSRVSFLQRCSEVLSIFWWPATVKINVVYEFGVASLTFVVPRSWSFIRL